MSETVDIGEMFYRLVQAEITVKYHNDMLLKGNGKPGLTVRMEKVEDRQDVLWKFFFAMVALCGTTMLSVMGAMAMIIYQGLKH